MRGLFVAAFLVRMAEMELQRSATLAALLLRELPVTLFPANISSNLKQFLEIMCLV